MFCFFFFFFPFSILKSPSCLPFRASLALQQGTRGDAEVWYLNGNAKPCSAWKRKGCFFTACGILLHLTHPCHQPCCDPAVSQSHSGGGSRGLQAPRGCRGDAGAGTPPARGCHINRFPGGDPRCGCSIFGRRGSPDVSLPGWHQAPELLWAPSQPHIPLGCHRHLGGLWDPEPMAGALSIHISWAAGCCLSSFQGGERSLYPAAP